MKASPRLLGLLLLSTTVLLPTIDYAQEAPANLKESLWKKGAARASATWGSADFSSDKYPIGDSLSKSGTDKLSQPIKEESAKEKWDKAYIRKSHPIVGGDDELLVIRQPQPKSGEECIIPKVFYWPNQEQFSNIGGNSSCLRLSEDKPTEEYTNWLSEMLSLSHEQKDALQLFKDVNKDWRNVFYFKVAEKQTRMRLVPRIIKSPNFVPPELQILIETQNSPQQAQDITKLLSAEKIGVSVSELGAPIFKQLLAKAPISEHLKNANWMLKNVVPQDEWQTVTAIFSCDIGEYKIEWQVTIGSKSSLLVFTQKGSSNVIPLRETLI